MAAATTNPLLFFGVVVPRMIVADPIPIALGRRYGARLVPLQVRDCTSYLNLLLDGGHLYYSSPPLALWLMRASMGR